MDKVLTKKENQKSIVIMLDLDGVIDGLNDEKAKLFINLLWDFKNLIQVDEIVFFLSSHTYKIEPIKNALDIFNKYLKPAITIGESYYLFGKYNYQIDKKEELYFGYNLNKINMLEKYYLTPNVKWCAIIDDCIKVQDVKKYQMIRPMTLFTPSQDKDNSKLENAMFFSTTTNGFDGALELLNRFKIFLEQYKLDQIFELQQKALFYPSLSELINLLNNKEYDLLLTYLKTFPLDTSFYEKLAKTIESDNLHIHPKYLDKFKEIVEIINQNLKEETGVKINILT